MVCWSVLRRCLGDPDTGGRDSSLTPDIGQLGDNPGLVGGHAGAHLQLGLLPEAVVGQEEEVTRHLRCLVKVIKTSVEILPQAGTWDW